MSTVPTIKIGNPLSPILITTSLVTLLIQITIITIKHLTVNPILSNIDRKVQIVRLSCLIRIVIIYVLRKLIVIIKSTNLTPKILKTKSQTYKSQISKSISKTIRTSLSKLIRTNCARPQLTEFSTGNTSNSRNQFRISARSRKLRMI